MNPWTQRAISALAAGACLALLGGGLAYRTLWERYDSGLQQLESRSERLDGIVAVGPQIETALAQARSTVQPWLHGGGEDSQNEVQQRLRQLISSSGATLISSQVLLEPGSEQALPMVKLTATLGGEWAAVVRFMQALQASTPPFWVRSASFLREGAHAGGPGQNVRLTLQLEVPLAAGAREQP